MGKKRGKYDKIAKIEQSDQQIAEEFIALLRREFDSSPNLDPIFYMLGLAKPAVRRRVIDTFVPARKQARGHPKRALHDYDILGGVEDEKKLLALRLGRKITDRNAIQSLFEKGHLHLGRDRETPFNAASIAGRQEMDRAIAAVVRARKALKSKITRTK